MSVFEKYWAMDIDTSLIGLEKGSFEGGYFCTPVGARVFGWEGSIHYCFIRGFGETVFAVNPETVVDEHVYPLAKNFEDFLRLILFSGSVTGIEQIIWMSKEKFIGFVNGEDNPISPGQRALLDTIKEEFGLTPMEDAYEYVKALQGDFDKSKLEFTNEYYDTLGIQHPDGTDTSYRGFEFEPVVFVVNKTDK